MESVVLVVWFSITTRNSGDGEVEQFVTQWKGFGEPYPVITSYRRPLMAMLNPLAKALFVLDEILEPKPNAQFQAADPEDYEKLQREPGFICFRARKPSYEPSVLSFE